LSSYADVFRVGNLICSPFRDDGIWLISPQILYERNNAERKEICNRMVQQEVDLFKRCQVEDDEEQPRALEVFRTVNSQISRNDD
jgi:hypothetical protein